MASNKGKKYVKLTGGEIATREGERNAARFMCWFAARFDEIKKAYGAAFNDEVAVDTALTVREALLYKNRIIVGKYRHYYIRAYNINMIQHHKAERARTARHVDIDDDADGRPLSETIAAVDYDPHEYEIAVNTLRAEVLEFVRAFHDPLNVALFEVYIELSPDVSYRRMADMFGVPYRQVWQGVGEVKRDVAHWFAERRAFLLNA